MAVFDRALLILMVGETVWILYRIYGHKKDEYYHGSDRTDHTRLKRVSAAPYHRPVV